MADPPFAGHANVMGKKEGEELALASMALEYGGQRTDALDSLGNTTAATGKGFAIGSAALTALALLVSTVSIVFSGLIVNFHLL